jgi:plasmid stabilization system protein ParE
MKVKYTNHFAQSLQQIIFYWINNLHISKDKVQRFVRQIEYKIDLLKHFPKMGQDVTELYQLERPTYRLLIGKSYEIFYRIDKQHQLIIIGSIFSADQMKIKF